MIGEEDSGYPLLHLDWNVVILHHDDISAFERGMQMPTLLALISRNRQSYPLTARLTALSTSSSKTPRFVIRDGPVLVENLPSSSRQTLASVSKSGNVTLGLASPATPARKDRAPKAKMAHISAVLNADDVVLRPMVEDDRTSVCLCLARAGVVICLRPRPGRLFS